MRPNDPGTHRQHGRDDEQKRSPARAKPTASYDETVTALERTASEKRETVREVLGALWIKAVVDDTA